VTRSRTVLILLVVVPALAVMVVGAPAAGASGGDGATAETAAKKKGKKKAARCKAAKGKEGKRKAKRSVADTAARKKGRKGKKKATRCKAAKGKGKKGPKTKQPTGGLSDGTYEDAANKVKMSIQDGATKVTVKLTVSSPALLTLTLSGALGSDGSAAGSSSAGVLGAVNWELQLSGTRYRLQYMFVGIGDQKVISGTLR
jgi:hypothetical protein